MHRCEAMFVFDIYISTPFNQELSNINMPMRGNQVNRNPTKLIHSIHIHALFEMSFNLLNITGLNCIMP